MAGLVSNVPGYVWLTEQKVPLFIASALLLLIAIGFRWRSRHAPCPADPVAARACNRLRRTSGVILYLSVAIYLIGGFFAFFAADLLL
jgi:hypothetical protein